jgi:hypothetical protein
VGNYLEFISESFIKALVRERCEFEAATRDYTKQVGGVLNDLIAANQKLTDLNLGFASQLTGVSIVASVLSRYVVYSNRLTPDTVLGVIAARTDDPAAVEFARHILGARPVFRTVETSPADAPQHAPSILREPPSLSIVETLPATRRE